MAELHDGRRAMLLARVCVFAPGVYEHRVLQFPGVFGGQGRVEWASEVVDINLDISYRVCQSCIPLG